MGFKDLLFKKEEVAPKKSQPKQNTPTQILSTPSSSTPIPSTISLGNESDQNEFTDYVSKVFQQRNFPGPDYQEFITAVRGMDKMAVDEGTKFNMVYTTLTTMGCDKAKLIDTANQYITIFNKLVADFHIAIDEKINNEVGQKQKNIDALKQENDKIEEQMRSLTEKKNKNNEVIQTTSIEVNNDLNKFNSKKLGLENSVNTFVANIQSDIEKIQKYIQ